MGNVLAILRAGASIPDPQSTLAPDRAPSIRLPDERYGLAFVFRVFDSVSYALIMESARLLRRATSCSLPDPASGA